MSAGTVLLVTMGQNMHGPQMGRKVTCRDNKPLQAKPPALQLRRDVVDDHRGDIAAGGRGAS